MNDLASRRTETIDHSVNWLVETLGLQSGSAVLDLGCGPGLYAARLEQHGIRVTGVDYSRRSIEYAIQDAQQQKLDIEYRYQNYLELADTELYDSALLIFGDFFPSHRMSGLDYSVMCIGHSNRVAFSYWTLQPVSTGSGMAVSTAGTWRKMVFGNRGRIWFLSRALTIPSNPFFWIRQL